MSLLPKSPKARRRLLMDAAIAPVLALAAGLAIWGLGDSVSFFYMPSHADAVKPTPGGSVQLRGLVAEGSVRKHADGVVFFTVLEQHAADRVVFQGGLPYLFREGQGVGALGAFRPQGVFEARRVVAKRDERYMPREVAKALKAQGEWRSDGAAPAYEAQSR